MKYKKLNTQQRKRLLKKLSDYVAVNPVQFDGGAFQRRGEYITISRPANSTVLPEGLIMIKSSGVLLYQDYKKEVVAFKVKGWDTKKVKKRGT